MARAPRNGPYICGIDAALDVVSGNLTEHGRKLNQALGPLGEWGLERTHREGSEMVDVSETSHA